MDFRWMIIVALSALLGSCAEVKEVAEGAADSAENVWKGKRTLTLTFQTHRPYCGGAKPTEEQLKGFTDPIANKVFYLYKDERPAAVKDMIKLTTDDKGTFKIDLKTGNYSIISGDKVLSTEAFIKKKKINDPLYTYSNDACFETWRTTPDHTVEVKASVTQVVTLVEKCFTGDNPCMKYTGPYPP